MNMQFLSILSFPSKMEAENYYAWQEAPAMLVQGILTKNTLKTIFDSWIYNQSLDFIKR